MDDRRRAYERTVFDFLAEAAAAGDAAWAERGAGAAATALENPDLARAIAQIGRSIQAPGGLPAACDEAQVRLVEAVGSDGRAPDLRDVPAAVAAHVRGCPTCGPFLAELREPEADDVSRAVDEAIAKALGPPAAARAPDFGGAVRRIEDAARGAVAGLVFVGVRPQAIAAGGEREEWSVTLVTPPAGDATETSARVELRLGQPLGDDLVLSLRPVGWPAAPRRYRFRVTVELTGDPAPDLDPIGLAPWVRDGRPETVEFDAALLMGEVSLAEPGRPLDGAERAALLGGLGRVVVEHLP